MIKYYKRKKFRKIEEITAIVVKTRKKDRGR